MTSRERVLASIAHRGSDQVPVDLGSNPSSGISALAYSHLLSALGAKDIRPRVYDVVQELAQPDDWILDRFGIDVADVGRAFNDRPEDWREHAMPGGGVYLYPAWFKPLRREDDFFVYDSQGTLLAQRPSGATFFDGAVSPTKLATRGLFRARQGHG